MLSISDFILYRTNRQYLTTVMTLLGIYENFHYVLVQVKERPQILNFTTLAHTTFAAKHSH